MTQPKAPSSTCKDCLSQHGEHLEGCVATYTHQTDDAPSSDTNELDRALKTLSQFFFEPTAKPTMAQVWGRAKIDILKWAATKEAEAYKKGYITGSADDILRPHKPPQYSAPKGFGQLKGDI